MHCFLLCGASGSAPTDAILWWVLLVEGCHLSCLRLSSPPPFLLIWNKEKQAPICSNSTNVLGTLTLSCIFWSCITGFGVKESFWFFTFYCFTALCHYLLNIHVKIFLWALQELSKIIKQFKSVCGVILSLFSVMFSFPLILDQVLGFLTPWWLSFPHNLPTVLSHFIVWNHSPISSIHEL